MLTSSTVCGVFGNLAEKKKQILDHHCVLCSAQKLLDYIYHALANRMYKLKLFEVILPT